MPKSVQKEGGGGDNPESLDPLFCFWGKGDFKNQKVASSRLSKCLIPFHLQWNNFPQDIIDNPKKQFAIAEMPPIHCDRKIRDIKQGVRNLDLIARKLKTKR